MSTAAGWSTTAGTQLISGGATGEPLLQVSGLCVDYGTDEGAVHAVIDADLVLRRGEVLGLAGESGSGKSTLAMAVTRLLRAPGVITGGEVLLHLSSRADGADGHTVDMLAADEEQLRALRWTQVAVVLQSAMNALNPVMSIGSQLTDVLKAHLPELGRAARRARAAELLAMVGITADRLGSYPHELSGGMRQRVMIAMALALEPQIVIMDEPTTALDVVTQREIIEELVELRGRLGFAVLFITHDFSLLVEIADSIAVMYGGRLVERASAASIFRAPRHPYTLGLLDSFPALHGARRRMTGIAGSPPDLRSPPGGCVFHPRCRYAMERCREDTPQLERLDGGDRRVVACWLHDGAQPVPAGLAAPEPGTGADAGPSAPVTGATTAGPPAAARDAAPEPAAASAAAQDPRSQP